MPARLFLRPQPRAYFLLSDTHALVFRQPAATESKATRSVVVAEFLPLSEVDTKGLVPVGSGRVEGVLGVTSVPSDRSPIPDVFLLLLSSSSPLGPVVPGSTLRACKVTSVEFHSLTSSFWDPPGLEMQSGMDEYDDFDSNYMTQTYPRAGTNGSGNAQQTQSLAAMAGVEDPCLGMKKYLESGGFFHAQGAQWDISRRLGLDGTNMVAAEKGRAHPLEGFDDRFVWNGHLLAPFLTFRAGLPQSARDDLDAHALLLPVIQGFVGSTSWPDNALALISRLSCKRAGARFRTRGIDDDGNVANFVETETILTAGETSLSYTQVRGSVPLFWQQPQQGLGTLQQKVEITRPPQATQPAFDKHFADLLDHYGAVHAINLLGQKDAESMLSAAYRDRFAALQAVVGTESLEYTSYDFHAVVRFGGHEAVRADLADLPDITESMTQFGITAIDKATGDAVEQQHGVFRTNCLDCLDRTNYVQEVLSSIALRRFLAAHGSVMVNSPTLWAAHRELWADNGDRLSKTYAGTGAINTSATRTGRKTLAGLLSDATKSVGRAYINNFQDKGKQTSIDMLLGLMAGQRPVVLFDPVGDSIQSALSARKAEYSSPRELVFFSGTWNVNGKMANEPLNPWLFPKGMPRADVYAIAFQEIVELTPQQIVQTDPAKKRNWEAAIMTTFSDEYILMRSEQLVGTALMVVVKASLPIRNVEYADKKTGLQGLSGNKGGVGIRFDVFDSSVCLMTCHLAAGQTNYTDRNADYRTISHGLVFPRGKTIDSHDIIIWAADFNYRVDMDNEMARNYIATDQLDALFATDQLAMARDDGEVFIGYSEGPITFRPTYKFDNGTDTYDSSEKQRVPSWTDRVLYKGNELDLLTYNSSDLRCSDHRPVYAILRAAVAEIDEAKKAQIADDLVAKARRSDIPMDSRVEQAVQGGVRSLVKEMTSVSINSSRFPSPAPPLPGNKPRKSSVSSMSSASSVSGRTINSINSAYDRIGIPPPLPPRQAVAIAPAGADSAPVAVPYQARRRAAPPPPTDSKKPSATATVPTVSVDDDEEMTPVATGDFVLVPSPNARRPAPPLPARSGSVSTASGASSSVASLAASFSTPIHAQYTRPKPQPQQQAQLQPQPEQSQKVEKQSQAQQLSTPQRQASLPPRLPARPEKRPTLDMDAPPPSNLIAPVMPDNKTTKLPPPTPGAKPLASQVQLQMPQVQLQSQSSGESFPPAVSPVKSKPRPPVPERKPSVGVTLASTAPAENGKGTKDTTKSEPEAEAEAELKVPEKKAPPPVLGPKPALSPGLLPALPLVTNAGKVSPPVAAVPSTTAPAGSVATTVAAVPIVAKAPPVIPTKPAAFKTKSTDSITKAAKEESKENMVEAGDEDGPTAAPAPAPTHAHAAKPTVVPKPTAIKGRQLGVP